MDDLLQFLYLMPVGVAKFRADGTVDMMNPVAASLLMSMTSPDSLQEIYTALAPIAPDLRERVAAFRGPSGNIIDQQWLTASVASQTLVLSLTVNQIKENVYMAVLTDVSRLVEQEQKLYVDRQKFFAIFDHVRDYAIYTTRLDGQIEEWNQSVQRYAGWLAADVQGRSMDMFFPVDDPNRPRIDLLLAEAQRIGSTETEGWALRRDGSRLWANSVITALPDEAGTMRGFVVVSRDITERKRLDDQLKQQATVDPLTSAYNRRKGDELLAVEFRRRARHGRPFAVLMMDVDHFKSFNDKFGHAVGDAVLCGTVQTCRDTLRSADMVVRWGGEEFLVLLPDMDAAAAMCTAERVRKGIEAMELAPLGPNIQVTISIGVAVPTSDSQAELMSRSDEALYAAKTGGRNRVVLAP